MQFIGDFSDPGSLRRAIEAATCADETECVEALLAEADAGVEVEAAIATTARGLVEEIRRRGAGTGGLDAFLHEYELSNKEGVVLMCLAEALLRIPDAETADRLIRDKLAEADWDSHLGHSASLFVNASTWALMLTGRVVRLDGWEVGDVASFFKRLVAKSGEPVIRQALMRAMRIMGRQFVTGRTIGEALARAKESEAHGYRYSYDMLGEAARTMEDANKYMDAYTHAIGAIGEAAANSAGRGLIEDHIRNPGISVKLSALHPRYELAQKGRVMDELAPRLLPLARLAREAEINLCVDAEEAGRLDISLDVIEAVSGDKTLAGWDGFGLAVQAYLKRAVAVIGWLADMARRHNRRLMVRLVKGAYWDTEIKRAQVEGLDGYPVFTRKMSTDVSYLACARMLLARPDAFYPQFATHNAHTAAAVIEFANRCQGQKRDYEFQRLHGMGAPLYDPIVGEGGYDLPCRVYAPVGSHEDLLAYLVRRLLENGANTSFVNRIVDEKAPVEDIIASPVARLAEQRVKPHPRIPLPVDLYRPARRNSRGLDLSDPAVIRDLARRMAAAGPWTAAPVIGGEKRSGAEKPVADPANNQRSPGTVVEATREDVDAALSLAAGAAFDWDNTPAGNRARCLERAADLMEDAAPELMALCVGEAGKTIPDAVAEVREAVDFLRYYAERARIDFSRPEILPGPTGEDNRISLHGRGVFACIAPWNFPLAIFTGQVGAALAAGNPVIAKPAEQTPLIAARAVEILHAAGIPGQVLHLLPGSGPAVGAPLAADARVAGVAFTGSVETARRINQALAARPGPIAPLIAETGGQNAMIVDSSALPEQVVEDVVASAFQSAGQRCSALRVLFVQHDISEKLIRMLTGAMAELAVGDPALLATDAGPVIDGDALAMLEDHARRMDREGELLMKVSLPKACERGTFFAPRAYRIDCLDLLDREVFGPILHVIPYAANRLDEVIGAVNATGYGLTLGVHSRVGHTQDYICARLRAGNAYVNRNMIGAVVGTQPFGGEGLSGTGPKAGGPRYLHRFATERTLSVNTAAAGGNAELMSLED